MGSHSLLQGICPTQGPNLGLLHYRWILYHLSHQGSSSLSLKWKVFILIMVGCSLDWDLPLGCTVLPHHSRTRFSGEYNSDPLQSSVFALKIASREELMTSYWAGNKGVKRMRLWTHEFSKTSQHIYETLFGTRAICLPDVSDRNVSMNLDPSFFFPSQLCSVARCSCVSEATTSIKLFVGWIVHACITSFLQQWDQCAYLSTFLPLIFFLTLLRIKLKASPVAN